MTSPGAPAALDETHDPAVRSWVESAHGAGTDFPPQNLPFGVFRTEREGTPRVGIAIGDEVLDCAGAVRDGLFDALSAHVRDALQARSLNALMALGRPGARAVRHAASRLLRADTAEGQQARAVRERILVIASRAEMLVPAAIGDYSDFYASVFHATNVGAMFRPDTPLLPNYKYVPVGYHGRASSIVASGTPVRRPSGQTRPDAAAPPVVRPTAMLDYEVEIGAFVGGENALGEPVPLARTDERLFGLALLNDWSARDVQSWEYQPLGPFLSKSFATTVGAWVVTLDALEPFRCAPLERPAGDPPPLPYLSDPIDRTRGAFDITLEASLRSAKMKSSGLSSLRLSSASFRSMYWTLGQLLAHHSSNGCNLRPGDLLGSGTVSGPEKQSRGCLMELGWRGAEPLTLPSGETRSFLADGDEVTFRGWCERPGAARIGFGECRGEVHHAI